MGNKEKGLYRKFEITRTDGKSEYGKKHFGCRYFALDLDHDPHSLSAIKAYIKSCANEYPLLAEDLNKWIKVIGKPIPNVDKEIESNG